MDFDNDGIRDIISGGYMGVPFFIKGNENSWQKPIIPRDKKGNHLHTGNFWNPDTEEHDMGKKDSSSRSYSALPIDWDNDGDYDLLRGTDRGGFFLHLNEGEKGHHSFSTRVTLLNFKIPNQSNPVIENPSLLSRIKQSINSSFAPKDSSIGYNMPIATDWDNDGLWDLICGCENGAVYYFKNTGTLYKPDFTQEPELLIQTSKSEGLGRGDKSQVEVCDWDGDGDLDILVGDEHSKYDRNTKKWDSHGYIWLYRNTLN